jgi:hypothetical protein
MIFIKFSVKMRWKKFNDHGSYIRGMIYKHEWNFQ